MNGENSPGRFVKKRQPVADSPRAASKSMRKRNKDDAHDRESPEAQETTIL